MTDREALYRAVLAAPADDLPRLVLADWFEENGNAERAGYIRAQVERSRLLGKPQSAQEFVTSSEVISAVTAEALWRWVDEDGLSAPDASLVPTLTRGQASDFDLVHSLETELVFGFRRGFVEEVRCRASFWVRNGRSIAGRAPVKTVGILDKRPRYHRQSEWVWATNVRAPGEFENVLPAAVFDCLSGRRAWAAVYATRRDAEAALSDACLAFAREAV